ncbi:MAG: acyltransferase family protein [Mucilaginibacter sp.]
MKYIKGLDTLRAFAVFFVIVAHWGPYSFRTEPLNFIFSKLMPSGMFGVDLFFVLSGYLITRILLNARNETSDKLCIIKNFYIRRALRIFPIYFLLVFIVAYVLGDIYVRNHLTYFLTYTSNFLFFKENSFPLFSHTWSLAVEEQFYIIWPWVIIYSPQKHLLKIILLSVIIGLVSSLILNHYYGVFSTILLLPCITAFAIGALYAYVQTYTDLKGLITKAFLMLLPIAILTMYLDHFGYKIVTVRGADAIIAINAIIYAGKKNYNQITNYLLNNKALVFVGKISYGIYLYHEIIPYYYYQFIDYLHQRIIINNGISKILTSPTSAYLIHLTMLLILSILSFRYIEQAFLRLKRNFNYVSYKKQHSSDIPIQGDI